MFGFDYDFAHVKFTCNYFSHYLSRSACLFQSAVQNHYLEILDLNEHYLDCHQKPYAPCSEKPLVCDFGISLCISTNMLETDIVVIARAR